MRKFIFMMFLYIIPFLSAHTTDKQTVHWTATYYGDKYKTPRKTASGERFNMHAMTCAAPPKYKFGTMLRVTNLANKKSVVVKVTDRGYLVNTIDLTYGAFAKIAKHRDGRVKIKVEVVS